MRILQVIETLGHGGAETVATNLTIGLSAGPDRGLADSGHDHDLRLLHCSSSNDCRQHQPFVDRMQAAGTAVSDVHWRELIEHDRRAGLLGGWRPDIVIFHWWRGHVLRGWMDQVAAQTVGHGSGERPAFVCVLHQQGDPDASGNPPYDRYVAVTPSQLPDLSAATRRRTRVIPNGIDLAPYADLPPPRDDRFTIGRLSSLRPGKLPPDWIATAAGFDLPKAHWVIAGEGSERPRLQQQARELGVAGRFEFPGYIEEQQRPDLLARFSVGCYVTGELNEAHPLALLETTAAGVPIVAERRGGLPDIVDHGINGLLADSQAEIGRHLRRLHDDPGLRRDLAAGARALAERFSLRHQLAHYRALIEEFH